MIILDGKKIKTEILNELKNEVSKLSEKPNFVVIQVGNDEASNVYISQKAKMAEYIGYGYKHLKLSEKITEKDLLLEIDKLNKDRLVHGVLVQMPLPKHIDASKIQNAVLPVKDIDGLSDVNAGELFHGKESLASCTPYGVMELLRRYNINPLGKHAVVVGRSNLVGKPMSVMLTNAGATVTLCHSKTKDLAKYTKMADILFVAVGIPKLITGDMVKDDAIVIDVGITRVNDKLCGDVDFDNVKEKCSYITPVPGGVGPMTVAMLGKNILKSYEMQSVRE